MSLANVQPETLHASGGDTFPLHEYHLQFGNRKWTLLHTGVVLTHADEAHFFRELLERIPYGVALWPASIALAHEVAARGNAFAGRTVLELGSGTGLPGIVAASLGARVVQTDRHELAMSVCRRNAERNGVSGVEHRLVDWTDWQDRSRYDWILGSDILYGEKVHPHLCRIFAGNLAPGGRVLLSDPFRAPSIRLLEQLQEQGWSISLSKWSLGDEDKPRPFGVFELTPP